MGFGILHCLCHQQIALSMSTTDVLDDGTRLSLIADHLNGGCPRGSLNLSDCQVSTHEAKIACRAETDESENTN